MGKAGYGLVGYGIETLDKVWGRQGMGKAGYGIVGYRKVVRSCQTHWHFTVT